MCFDLLLFFLFCCNVGFYLYSSCSVLDRCVPANDLVNSLNYLVDRSLLSTEMSINMNCMITLDMRELMFKSKLSLFNAFSISLYYLNTFFVFQSCHDLDSKFMLYARKLCHRRKHMSNRTRIIS